MEEFTASKASTPTALPWEWIVEKLVDNKEIGTPLLKAMIMNIPDMNSPYCSNLQEKIALRYLEEVLFYGKFETHAISLIKVFANSSMTNSTAAQELLHDLLLRVGTEVVLGHIREANENGERDWEGFEDDLKQAFTEDNLSPPFIRRRSELLGLLKDKSSYILMLEKYPVEALKSDLLHFIREKKSCLNKTVIDQLVCGITDERYTCTSFLHCKHSSPTGEECSNGGCRKRFYREATLECEHRSSEGQKSLKHGGNDSSPSHIEKTKECMMTSYNVSENCFEVKKDLGSRTENLNRDTEKTINDSPDTGCRQELHCNRNKEILQVSSGTESSSNDHCHGGDSTDNDVPGLEGKISRHVEGNNSDAEGRKEDHLLDSEELPELDRLFLRSECPGQICFRCSKGGELSTCDGCSITVHDKCLESDISITSGEHVSCPVCSYKRALASYKIAKKEALESKKRLLVFIDIKPSPVNGEKSQDRGKSEKEICCGTGNTLKDPSSHVCAFNLGSKRKQLPLRTRSSESLAHEIEIPNGIGNGQQFMQTVAHDGRHDGDIEQSHNEDRKYSLRNRKPQMRGATRLPGARRNKLPWTKDEEQILKEGMQKFSLIESNGIPWKRILNYGNGIFRKSRLPVDLKDKWRNMKKGSS